MPDIFHHFQIKASVDKVFRTVSEPEGLDIWWTKTSTGKAAEGTEYKLGFGPGYDWHAVVTKYVSDAEFELKIAEADEDWIGSRIGFHLDEKDGITNARFHHIGWKEDNEHYRISCYCWAMYLRLMKRYVEHGEIVSYEDRLDV